MDKSFGLFFYLKKRRKQCTNEFDVYVRITVDSYSIEISTKRKCNSKNWNVHAGRMIGKNETVKSFNAYLDTLQQKIFEAKRKLIELDKEVTPKNIKLLYSGKSLEQAEKIMLMDIFKQHNEQIKELVGIEYSSGTLVRYETSFRHTQSFLTWKYKISDIDIQKLDFKFIADYEFWLKSVRKCDHNTTMKYLSNFKKITNKCIHYGWLQRDPFIAYKMTHRPVDRTALTELELQKIRSKEFHVERLKLVRDIFLFSCFTGLAYADVRKLKRSEIIIGNDNAKWLVSKRQKTDTSARIPLLPFALRLIDQYGQHIQSKLSDSVFPVLSNQKMNAYLKEIADLCGITKKLTYHIARHTFATTITLSNGVPIETVSKMLGHRNLKTTQHYARILDKKIGEDMQSVKEKFSMF
jgi:site-specific recombinase XerD